MEKAKIDQLEKKIGQLEEERRLLEERLYPSGIVIHTNKKKVMQLMCGQINVLLTFLRAHLATENMQIQVVHVISSRTAYG